MIKCDRKESITIAESTTWNNNKDKHIGCQRAGIKRTCAGCRRRRVLPPGESVSVIIYRIGTDRQIDHCITLTTIDASTLQYNNDFEF